MDEKKYVKLVFSFIAVIAALGIAAVIIIDPYFHYHKPIDGLAYQFTGAEERYINDGIVKNFDYDAIIAGTSMTENFKSSECDELFGVNSIKVPLNGSYFKEVSRLLDAALEANPDVKCIFRSVDYSMMNVDKDTERSDAENFPVYLYDSNPINDVKYILNKTVLLECLEVLQNTLSGEDSTSFDEYANWNAKYEFGRAAILRWHVREPKVAEELALTEAERNQIAENIMQNLIPQIQENPDVEFYLFFPPYSAYYWDTVVQKGQLQQQLEMERIALELLLPYENVNFFSFANNFYMVCDANNYKDTAHYGEWINSNILDWMSKGEYQLTMDNYEAYLTEVEEFYSTYDFASLYVY